MNSAISIMTLYKQKYNAVHTPNWEYKSPSLVQGYRATAVLWAFLIAYPSTNDNNTTVTTHRLASHVFLDGKVGDWTDASATDNLFHQDFRGCRAGLLPWRQIRRQKSSYEIADDVGVTRPRIYNIGIGQIFLLFTRNDSPIWSRWTITPTARGRIGRTTGPPFLPTHT